MLNECYLDQCYKVDPTICIFVEALMFSHPGLAIRSELCSDAYSKMELGVGNFKNVVKELPTSKQREPLGLKSQRLPTPVIDNNSSCIISNYKAHR